MISDETAYGCTSFPNCHQSDFSVIVVNVYFLSYLQPFLSQSNALTLVQQYLYSSTAHILGFQSDSIKVWLKSTFSMHRETLYTRTPHILQFNVAM